MERFQRLTSRVIPLPLKDVDTDMIIPAAYLTSVSRQGYGENLFRRLRDKQPDFPFNLDIFKGAQILAADDNFGCGSSREHAVWALTGWGIRAVIAKSFADIFSGNAGKNGLVLVKLPPPVVDGILAAAAGGNYTATVDLERQEVALPSGAVQSFEFNAFRKHCILSGLDDIDYIRSREREIAAYRRRREVTTFFSVLKPNQ